MAGEEKQPEPDGNKQSLEDQIKALQATVDHLTDVNKQISETQNKLAGATVKAGELATTAINELNKTKSEFSATMTAISNSIASLPQQLETGMKGAAANIAKQLDERMTAVLGQQNSGGADDGGESRQVAATGGRGGGADMSSLMPGAVPMLEALAKVIAAWKGTQSAGTMAADQVVQGFKIAKLFNNLEVAKTDVAEFSKLAHEALDTSAPKA